MEGPCFKLKFANVVFGDFWKNPSADKIDRQEEDFYCEVFYSFSIFLRKSPSLIGSKCPKIIFIFMDIFGNDSEQFSEHIQFEHNSSHLAYQDPKTLCFKS